MHREENPYLAGSYAPVGEERTITSLEVSGTIPESLDGRYVRNGPNPISEVDPGAYHWFVGDGMVHGVRLRDGRAEWYRNRWVRSPAAAATLGEGGPAGAGRLGMAAAGAGGLGANTNVIEHGGRTLALVEGGVASYELGEQLDTVGPCDFGGTLAGGFTAHPKRDPATGELHAVSYHFGRGATVQYTVVGADGRVRRTVDVPVTGSPMMHDFALTERHVVLLDLPVTFDPARAVAGRATPGWLRRSGQLVFSALTARVRVPDPLVARGMAATRNGDLPYSWDRGYPARIGVLPREGTAADVRWFDVDPCYVFHTLGARDRLDEDGTPVGVVVDAVRHPRMFDTDPHGPNEGCPRLYRWELDLGRGHVSGTELDGHGQEFPRMDERRLGGPYRYGYSLGVAPGGRGAAFDDLVMRHDLEAGTTTRRSLGPRARGGEFVFVPRAADAAEDDGVLMGFVHDLDTDTSRLAILDAASLDPVADVHLPTRVPQGFHGNWLPAPSLGAA